MNNLIKMNVIRLFCSRGLWILLFSVFAVVFLLSFLEADPQQQKESQKIMEELGEEEQSNGKEQLDAQIGLNLQEVTVESSLEDIFAGNVSSGIMLMLAGVFTAAYCDEERKSGFLKNLTVGTRQKKYVFLAKIPVLFAMCLLLLLITLLAVCIGSNLTGHYSIASVGNLGRYLLVQAALHMAFILFLMAIYELFRSKVLTTLVAVFGSLNLFGFIVSVLESKIGIFRTLAEGWSGRFELVQYLLVTRVKGLALDAPSFPYVPSIVVAAIGFLLYAVLGTIIFSKRDTI